MNRKNFLVITLFILMLSLTGCSKIYINNQKSTKTTVVPGSEIYLKRILNTVYNDERFDVKSNDIIYVSKNTTLDNENYYYYTFSNNDILRISENYDFVMYENCEYYNLTYTMPSITKYDSAIKYPVNTNSKWYFVWYNAGEGTNFENEIEEVDESMFDNYKIDWIKNASTAEEFVKVRYFHYYYLKYIDELLKNGEYPYSYEDIKEIYSFNLISNYDQEILDNFNSFLYFAYYENGSSFDIWLKGILGEDVYNYAIASITPEDNDAINEYISKLSVKNNLFCIEEKDSSSLNTILDSKLNISNYTYSLDFNITSLYNNYNSNNNIIYVDEEEQERLNEEGSLEGNQNNDNDFNGISDSGVAIEDPGNTNG